MATVESTYVPRIFSVPISGEKKEPIIRRKTVFSSYKPFASHPGSSPDNFVPADWVISRLADILHVSDSDLKRK